MLTMWLFGKKQDKTPGFSDELATFDPAKEEKALIRKEQAELTRQRIKLDLEAHRLELEVKKQEMQMELERLKFEREIMQQERIQKWQDLTGGDDDEEEGDTLDSALIKILGRAFTPQQASAPVTTPAPAPAQVVSLTHQQIKAQLDSLPPQYKEMAKKMSDEDIRRFAIEQLPNIDADSTNRVVEVVRSL